MTNIQIRVKYINFKNEEICIICKVYETKDTLNGPPAYYATAAGLGCGKNASTPDLAARRLVQDHSKSILFSVEM